MLLVFLNYGGNNKIKKASGIFELYENLSV